MWCKRIHSNAYVNVLHLDQTCRSVSASNIYTCALTASRAPIMAQSAHGTFHQLICAAPRMCAVAKRGMQ